MTVVRSQLCASIKHYGEESPYVRVSKGTFALKSRSFSDAVVPKKLTPDVDESEEEKKQYDIVSSFGMFWKRTEWNGHRCQNCWGFNKSGQLSAL